MKNDQGEMNMAENEEIKALEEKTEKTEETEQVIGKKPEEAAVSKASKDDISALNDRELLIALLKEQKKASRRSLITATALVAICLMVGAALLIIVPRVTATLNNAYQAIDNVETVVANANNAIGSVEKSLEGIDKMVQNVDKVVVDNTDSVSKTVDRMSSIDIASLNKSIKDLSDIIEPLAKFFRR